MSIWLPALRSRCAPVLGLLGLAAFGCGGSATPLATALAVSAAAGAGTTLVSLGATLQLQARPVDASGKPVDRTGILTWSSSDPAVASVDAGGLLTARSNGTCSVSASLGTLAGALQITVAQAPGQLTITPPSSTLEQGAVQQFSAVLLDALGSPLPAGFTATWSASPEGLLSLSPTGAVVTVTALAPGDAQLGASASGRSASATVHVTPPGVRVVTLAPASAGASTTLAALGATLQLQARDASGPLAAATLRWSSSRPSVATVDASGLVTARSNGSATIEAQGTALDPGATLAVTVAQAPAQVVVTPSHLLLAVGSSRQFHASVSDANGNAIAAPGTPLWSITPDGVATLDTAGNASGTAPGSATVTAAFGSATGSAPLTVVVAQDFPFGFADTGGLNGQQINVAPGTAVTWTNPDDVPHGVVNDSGSAFTFLTETLGQGETSSPIVFSQAGSFSYHCTIHGATMHGTITVAP